MKINSYQKTALIGLVLVTALSVSYFAVKGVRRTVKTDEAKFIEIQTKNDRVLLAYLKKMDLFQNKFARALKEFSDPSTSQKDKMKIVDFLRLAKVEKVDKPILRAALEDSRYDQIHNHLELAMLHGILDHPEESDKEYILDLLKRGRLGWVIYALPKVWDDRYIPYLLDAIRDKPRSADAIDMIKRAHDEKGVPFKEAVPLLEMALQDDDVGVPNAAWNALLSITGKRYER